MLCTRKLIKLKTWKIINSINVHIENVFALIGFNRYCCQTKAISWHCINMSLHITSIYYLNRLDIYWEIGSNFVMHQEGDLSWHCVWSELSLWFFKGAGWTISKIEHILDFKGEYFFNLCIELFFSLLMRCFNGHL